jgi:hypothetical protein
MTTNSNFNFTNTIVTLELPFSEHIEELRQRIFSCVWNNFIVNLCIDIKD